MRGADGSRATGLSSMSFSLSRLTGYLVPVLRAWEAVTVPSRDLERSRVGRLAGISGGAGLTFPSSDAGLCVGQSQFGFAFLQMVQ